MDEIEGQVHAHASAANDSLYILGEHVLSISEDEAHSLELLVELRPWSYEAMVAVWMR